MDYRDRFNQPLDAGDIVMVDDFTLAKVTAFEAKIYGTSKVMVTTLADQRQIFFYPDRVMKVKVGPGQKVVLDAFQLAEPYSLNLID